MRLQQFSMPPNMFVLRVLKTCPLMFDSDFVPQTHLVDYTAQIDAYILGDWDAMPKNALIFSRRLA